MIKKIIPLCVCIVIMLSGYFYQKTVIDAANTNIVNLEAQLARLEEEYKNKQSTQDTANQQVVQQATGLVQERKDSDDSKVSTFMNTTVTWSSFDEYTSKRQSVIDTYNPDQAFLDMFFPEVGVAVAADGTVYNRIDVSNLSMMYSGMRSYVVNMEGGTYSYLAVVNVMYGNGNEDSEVSFVLTYNVDANGNISNLKGIM